MSEEDGNLYKCEICGSIYEDLESAENCERRCRAKRDLFGETVKNVDAAHKFNFKYIKIFIVIALVTLGGSAFWYLNNNTSYFGVENQGLGEGTRNESGVKTAEETPLLAEAAEEETDAIDIIDSGNASPTSSEASSEESGEEGATVTDSVGGDNASTSIGVDSKDDADVSTSSPDTASGEDDGDSSGIRIILTDVQKEMLKSFGIDPNALPEELTPEMEQCFIDKLGEKRVNEIIDGATPDIFDFFKAKSCIGY